MPGLGHLYNGEPDTATAVITVAALLPLVGANLVWGTFAGLVGTLLASLAWSLGTLVHAATKAKRLGEVHLRWYQRWPVYLLVCLLAPFAAEVGLRAGLGHARFHAYRIPTAGMEDSVRVGDVIVADTWAYRRRQPDHGDVIVFQYPPEPSKDFIKRCVGLPGETVDIRDKRVALDGVLLDEPYAIHTDPQIFSSRLSPPLFLRRDQMPPYHVPEGSFFCLGDNRDSSYDSRFWGPVERRAIKGKALYICWAKNHSRIGSRVR